MRIRDWSADVCSADLSSPRISRMPSPGASLIEISDSLNVTPPSTGLKAHSDGPSRSTLVITPDLATATCTAAATLMLVSSMQPIMPSCPYSDAMSAMRISLEMQPALISLMLMMSIGTASAGVGEYQYGSLSVGAGS